MGEVDHEPGRVGQRIGVITGFAGQAHAEAGTLRSLQQRWQAGDEDDAAYFVRRLAPYMIAIPAGFTTELSRPTGSKANVLSCPSSR